MSKNQPFVTFDHKKTQSRADKNHSFSAIAAFRFHCRDKIEPNLQSQNVRRTHSNLVESRYQRDTQIITLQRGVNDFFAKPEDNPNNHGLRTLSANDGV